MRDFDPTASEFISSGYLAKSKPGGLMYDPGTATVASIAAPIVGGMMGSDAASSAANTQAQSATQANALQKQMYDQTRADNAGVRARGDAAGNRLSYLLGLQPTSSAPAPASGASYSASSPTVTSQAPNTFQVGQTSDPLWEKILGDFQSAHQDKYGRTMDRPWNSDADSQRTYNDLVSQYNAQSAAQNPATSAAQPGAPGSADTSYLQDPAYGSLARSFGMSDFQKDPGYQFRMDEGQKGVENSAAARGMQLSGASLKAIQKYGSDYASNEYGKAYDRFNNDNTTQYNRLAGVAGSGQQATNNVNAAGADYGKIAGNNITSAGSAQASGIIGSNNNLTNGISSAISQYNYQNNPIMNAIRNPGGGQSSFSGVDISPWTMG